MKIQIFGSGCPTCKNLYELTKTAVAGLGIEAEVEYITDITKLAELGVMQSPVMTIDGKIAMLGSGNLEKVKEVIKGVDDCCCDGEDDCCSEEKNPCSCGGNC